LEIFIPSFKFTLLKLIAFLAIIVHGIDPSNTVRFKTKIDKVLLLKVLKLCWAGMEDLSDALLLLFPVLFVVKVHQIFGVIAPFALVVGD